MGAYNAPPGLEIPEFPYNTLWDRSILPVVSIQYLLVTDGWTDTRRQQIYTALAQRRAVKKHRHTDRQTTLERP